MPVLTDTAHSISGAGTALIGRTAPRTGYYYREIYQGIDSTTGVPVLELQLVPTENAVPTREITIGGSSYTVPTQAQGTTTYTDYIEVTPSQDTAVATTTSASTGGFPWGGLVVLLLLGAAAWFIYFLIRMWQDHQAQIAVMRAGQSAELPVEPILDSESVVPAPAPIIARTDGGWRAELKRMDAQLNNLLETAGVSGDTMEDKLKNVSAGQFASVDIAWEAHQSAKALLGAPDSEVTEDAVTRVQNLYKQVFADHGVV